MNYTLVIHDRIISYDRVQIRKWFWYHSLQHNLNTNSRTLIQYKDVALSVQDIQLWRYYGRPISSMGIPILLTHLLYQDSSTMFQRWEFCAICKRYKVWTSYSLFKNNMQFWRTGMLERDGVASIKNGTIKLFKRWCYVQKQHWRNDDVMFTTLRVPGMQKLIDWRNT